MFCRWCRNKLPILLLIFFLPAVCNAKSNTLNLVGLVTCFHDGNKDQESPAKNIMAIPNRYPDNMAISDEFGSYILKDLPKSLIDNNVFIYYRDTHNILKRKFYFIALENLEEYKNTLRYRLPRALIEKNCAELNNDAEKTLALRETIAKHSTKNKNAGRARKYAPLVLVPIPVVGGLDLINENIISCNLLCPGNLVDPQYLLHYDLQELFLYSQNVGFNLTASRNPSYMSSHSRNLYRHVYLGYRKTKVGRKDIKEPTESEYANLLFHYKKWRIGMAYNSILEEQTQSEKTVFSLARNIGKFDLGFSVNEKKLKAVNKERFIESELYLSMYPTKKLQLTLSANNLRNRKIVNNTLSTRLYGAAAKYSLGRTQLGMEMFQRQDDAKIYVGLGIDYKPVIPHTRIQIGSSNYSSTSTISFEYYGIILSYTNTARFKDFFSVGLNWQL